MKKTIFIYSLLLLFAEGFAREFSFSSSPLTMKDGLRDNNVTCIVQDQKGLMWFGVHKDPSFQTGEMREYSGGKNRQLFFLENCGFTKPDIDFSALPGK